MNVVAAVGLSLAGICGVVFLVLWFGSALVIDDHEDRIAGLEKWRDQQYGGPNAVKPDELPTDEIPAQPATVPDGIAIQVQSALLRPSPVPRGKSAEWVEEAIKGFNFTGRDR